MKTPRLHAPIVTELPVALRWQARCRCGWESPRTRWFARALWWSLRHWNIAW